MHIGKHINPLSASCSCDARIGGCRQNRLLGRMLAEWAAWIHQSEDTIFPSEPLTDAFHSGYQTIS